MAVFFIERLDYRRCDPGISRDPFTFEIPQEPDTGCLYQVDRTFIEFFQCLLSYIPVEVIFPPGKRINTSHSVNAALFRMKGTCFYIISEQVDRPDSHFPVCNLLAG